MNDSPRVAYFCMEYGLDDQLRIYSGGLGILAGDHLKAAHDLDLPLVAIGVKWKRGYGTQVMGDDGMPTYAFPDYHYDFLEDTGVEVQVEVANQPVKLKVWKCEGFGNATLYLLDADVPGNPEPLVTGRLYSGSPDERVAQEIVLGVGGVRALRALGIDVDVYHFNEGHALLAAFELIREKMEEGASYEDAFARTREEVVFTTHTPVKAGNEEHPIERLTRLGADLGLGAQKLEAIGGSPFNMTVGGLRMARNANAVAQLHGYTAGQMWAHVSNAAEIIAITNGVHHDTWVDETVSEAALAGDTEAMWTAHQANKHALLNHVAKRTGVNMKEDVLTIGFARRAVLYKRADLIFAEEDLIRPLLEEGKLQLVFSGKNHPDDEGGAQMVARLAAFSRRYPNAVAYIPDYDMATGMAMTRGADVWLNNPRRPKEASGTSGMKAAMNGVLNLSTLDGWWPEACEHGENGWGVGAGYVSPDERSQDDRDRASLYRVLLGEVLPAYYDAPARWKRMMVQSVRDTHAPFSAARMVREYFERMYPVQAAVAA
jgi:starch phosphorylase